MRRPQIVLLASMLLTAGASVAACSSTVDTENAGGSGGTGGASSSSSSVTTGGLDAGPDVDHGMPSDVYPAPHAPPPTVINCSGDGPVLHAPNVYPIFFPADDLETQILDFTTNLGAQPYWPANVKEYGVGALTGMPAIDLTETAVDNTTDDEIQTWLKQHIDGTLQPQFLPAPDANTLYAIFYPSTTTITQTSGGQTDKSCDTFGGYHSSVLLPSGQEVAYAVIPRCDDFDGFTGIDAVTAAASHELIEASTDPYALTNAPAFCQTDNDHLYWAIAYGGGETGDMCAQDLNSFTHFDPFPYVIQRSWSNTSAHTGHDPCVPGLPGAPYFNTAPVLPDFINAFGGQVHGIHIAEGETGVVELDLFSDVKTGPWQIDVHNMSLGGHGGFGALDFSLDRTEGQNGEKVYLSITVNQATQFKTELFVVRSNLNGLEHEWIGIVGN